MNSSDVAPLRTARLHVLVLIVSLAALWLAFAPQSAAAADSCLNPGTSIGTPGLTLTKDQPAKVLYANSIPVTLRAQLTTSPEWGFNLSFRDVLPPGVSYKSGSASVAPKIIADHPAPGYTTLLFQNVADLAPGSTQTLSYEAEYTAVDFDAGDTITTGADPDAGPPAYPEAAGAYVNCHPRWVPLFDANGVPRLPSGADAGHSYTGSGTTAPKTTELTAIEIEKSEPSPEHELLRGVHKQQTVYTLTLRNNTVNPTDNLMVTDYLPAGLEFLGCGTVDNTTDAPTNPGSAEEYPGSGPINPGNAPAMADCVDPVSVEFGSFDPDGSGPEPAGSYTKVVWDLSGLSMAAGDVHKLQYAAAVPICPNTETWSGSEPTAASLEQTANLDNNVCSGSETQDEQSLQNFATVTGDYHPAGGAPPRPVSDTDDLTVAAEDLAIWKEGSSSEFAVGEVLHWQLHVRTGEYRDLSNLVLTDTAPNGTCPVVGTVPPAPNNTPFGGTADAECDPTGAAVDNPTATSPGSPAAPAPWNGAVENADGSWDVTWEIPAIAADTDAYTIEFATVVRTHYQKNGADDTPVLADDSLKNEVEIEGVPSAVTDVPTFGPIPATIEDRSSAGVTTRLPDMNKMVAKPETLGTPVDCKALADGGAAEYTPGTQGFYRPGDIVCWKLHVHFPGDVSTGGISLTDFLPTGMVFDPTVPGQGVTGHSQVDVASIDDHGSYLDFNLDITDDIVALELVHFEYVLATRVSNTVAVPGTTLPQIRGNLLKMTSVNTAGEVRTYRDQANADVETPELAITKGVKRLKPGDAASGPNIDGGTLTQGQPVEYRIDVSNAGVIESVDTVVLERLVGPYDCTMVSDISDSGTCSSSGSGATAVTEIRWSDLTVAEHDGTDPGKLELNFKVTYPDTIAPGTRINDNACVVSFANETNDPLAPRWNWDVPNAVDDCGAPSTSGDQLWTAPINDPSWVVSPGSVAKTATTAVVETNNNLLSQATIGELITYSVTATIPDQTTIRNLKITDLIKDPTRQVYVTGSAQCDSTIANYCLGATLTHGTPADTVTLTNPASWTNATGDPQTITLIFQVKVADVPVANSAGTTLTNEATVSYDDQYGNKQSKKTNKTTVTIVEPNPKIKKADNVNPDHPHVLPSDQVEYTLTVTNPNRTSPSRPASPSHDSVVVDTVPAGLTPVDAGGTPIPDAGNVVRCDGSASGPVNGVWNSTARTITWTLGTIAPASTTSLRYCTEVDPGVVGGSKLKNTATVTGDSMPGLVPGERSYNDKADNTLIVEGLTVSKIGDPDTAAVGEKVQYTVTVDLPQNVVFHDLDLVDTLPAGVSWVSFDSTACTPAAECVGVATPVPSRSGQTLTWSYGTVPHSVNLRTLTITYTVIVNDVPANVDGTILTNAAVAEWCTVDVPPDCDPADQETSDPPSNHEIKVIEPELTIEKGVAVGPTDYEGAHLQPGDGPFTYTVTVKNTGSSTAWDAKVVDTVPATITPMAPYGGGVWNATLRTITWTVSEITAGSSAVFTYQADLADSSGLTNPFEVENVAAVDEYHSTEDHATNPESRRYTGPDDSTKMNGHLPEPKVVKTVADSGHAELDQPLVWTLTISNESAHADLNKINVVDDLPAGWEYVAASAKLDGVALEPTVTGSVTAGQKLTWTDIGDISAGGTAKVITFAATPRTSALDSNGDATNPYTNTVKIDGEDNTGSDCSGTPCVPYESTDTEDASLELPELTIVKSPDDATVTAGTWNSWTVVVTNSGLGKANDVTLRDAVPAGLSWDLVNHPASAVCSPSPCDGFTHSAGDTSGTGAADLTWSLDSLAAGQSVTLTLPMFVPAADVDDTEYENTAYTKSKERPTENDDSGTWKTVRSADLAITKVGTPNPASAGGSISYTLTVTNNGPSVASGVTVEDLIDTSVFEFVSVTPGSAADSCTTSGSPIDTVECQVAGTMALDATATFTLVLKTDPTFNGNAENTASVDGNEDDPDPGNNEDTEIVPVTLDADLGIVKDGPAWGAVGHELQYTLTVTNHGPSTAVNAVVQDVLPAGLTFVSATSTLGTCSDTPPSTIDCTLGTLLPGQQEQIVVKVVPEQSVVHTTVTNTAETSSDTPDSNPDNNEDLAQTPIEDNTFPTTSNLTVVKSVSNASPRVGDEITYTVVTTNHGPDTARNATLTDTLPAGLIFVSAKGEGTCSFKAPVISCQLGDVPAGATRTILVRAIVARTGQTVNSAVVDADNDRNPDDNSAVSPIQARKSTAKLKLTKQASKKSVKVGQKVRYTIKVRNVSKTTAVNVEVCDLVPARLTVVKKAKGKLKGGNLCWSIPLLKPGKMRTFKPTFRVTNGRGASVTNPVRARANNAKTVRAKAKVRVPLRKPRAGGTTG